MKKSLFIIAAAALVVGCASDGIRNNVVEDNTVLIGFGDSYIGKKTKAVFGEINDSASLAKDGSTLKVWGWKNVKNVKTQVFNNQRVAFNSASSQETTSWEYTPLKYWDLSAKEYLFLAVAPDTAKFTLNSDTLVELTGLTNLVAPLYDNNGASKVTSANTKAVDFLVADKVRKAPKGNAPDNDVQFTFSHILSKLTVRVKTTSDFNNTGSNYPQIKLTSLKIHLKGMCPDYDQKTLGVVTAAETDGDTWSGTPLDSTVYTCFALKTDDHTVDSLLLASDRLDSIAAYLVTPTATGATPAKYNYYATVGYDIIYSANEQESFLAESKLIPTLKSFVQNTSNTLTITIDPKIIYFDVKTVKDWTSTTDNELTIE